VISLKLREGRGLQLVLASDGVTASDAADGLRIRLTLGSLRTCVEFGPETVVASSQRSFVAADAPKAAGYDCSYGP
jgi:hypothetical protein